MTSSAKRVRVCTNRTCRKQGAKKVLAALRSHPLENVIVEESSCLGQCGNGPIVFVLPEEIWYSRVHPDEVPAVVERHLKGGNPVKGMLYDKFHRELKGKN